MQAVPAEKSENSMGKRLLQVFSTLSLDVTDDFYHTLRSYLLIFNNRTLSMIQYCYCAEWVSPCYFNSFMNVSVNCTAQLKHVYYCDNI